MKLKMSVSQQTATTKTDAGRIAQFVEKSFDADEATLKDIFTTKLYSMNMWRTGRSMNKNFEGMTGIIFDVDENMPLVEAKEIFKDFNYIIHTSTSHRANDPRKGGAQDRFRVLLPFDPSEYDLVNEADQAKAVYVSLLKKYPFVDPRCTEGARKYYPFLNKEYPDLFEMYIHEGVYFKIEKPASTKISKNVDIVDGELIDLEEIEKVDSSNASQSINLDTVFLLKDRKTKRRLRDIDTKTEVFCLFCDDIDSQAASAVIQINAKSRRKMLYCSHCKKTWMVSLKDSYPELFYLGSNLHRVYVMEKNIEIDYVPPAYINGLHKGERDKLLRDLAHSGFANQSFTVRKMTDAYKEEVSWEMDHNNGVLSVYIPPVAPVIADNEYINKWLDELFLEHSEFIKDYLALYCYTNYLKLPFIALAGPRGAGKSTFAEMMMDMFPVLSANWSGKEESFTEDFQKKLLVADEAQVDKKEQFLMLKRLGGTEKLNVNIKHGAKFQVRNNLKIIIMTNDKVPIYLAPQEQPTAENNNQFFLYQCESTKSLNAHIKYELQERIGHYIRTELRERFEKWKASGVGKANRYSIPVPITDFLRQQYHDAKSVLDYEAEEVYNVILHGRSFNDPNGTPKDRINKMESVTINELRLICTLLRAHTKNPKMLRERMQWLGFLGSNSLSIRKDGNDAWPVLPDKRTN